MGLMAVVAGLCVLGVAVGLWGKMGERKIEKGRKERWEGKWEGKNGEQGEEGHEMQGEQKA